MPNFDLNDYRSHPIWAVSLVPERNFGFASKKLFYLRWGNFEASIYNDLEAAAKNGVPNYWIATVQYNKKAKKSSPEWYTSKENAAEWARQEIDDWDNRNRGNKV